MDVHLQELFEAGRRKFLNQDFEEAERCLSQVLSTARNYADVYNMLGVIWHDQGKFDRALEAFREALRINPAYTEASLNLAVVYNDLGRYDEAKEAYSQAKDRSKSAENDEPDRFVKGKIANMHAEIGTVYAGIAMFTEAVEEYRAALRLRPEFVDIRTKLASTLRENGNWKEAIGEFKLAKKERPDYAPARIGLGLAYYTGGQLKEAINEWKGVVKQDPGNSRAHMYLRLVSEMEGDRKSKKKTAKKASKTKKVKSKSKPKRRT